MARTKPDKTREETYDMIVGCLKSRLNKTPVGRSSEGLVYENHLDGGHVVIKVIKKKEDVPMEEISPVLNYAEQMAKYEEDKNKKQE